MKLTDIKNPYVAIGLKGIQRDITPGDIVSAVCEVTKVSHETIMMRRNRRTHVVIARFMAWKIIKENDLMSLGDCGKYFNGYDHTSVLHGIRAIQDDIDCHYRGLKPSPLGDCFSFQLYSI